MVWNYYRGYEDPRDPNYVWANPAYESQTPYFIDDMAMFIYEFMREKEVHWCC